ncbi:hypothetical protein LJR164_001599 [Phenylobacterium sp. LjRoot164]
MRLKTLAKIALFPVVGVLAYLVWPLMVAKDWWFEDDDFDAPGAA